MAGPPKGSGGRPPKITWDEQMLKHVERLASKGLSIKQICALLGITDRTWRKNCKKTYGLNSAFKKGRAAGVELEADILHEEMRAGYNRLKAVTYFLDRRGGWNAPEPEIDEKESDLNLENLTEKEQIQLDELLRKIEPSDD